MITNLERTTELTTAQAAALAGVSEKSIRNWIKSGNLAVMASTEGRRIDKAVLMEYLRERAQMAVEHLPQEVRPELPPESVAAPVAAPEPVPAESPGPSLTPELINVVLQPLLEELEKERKEKRRLHDENVELAGRVGYYQAELAQYKDRVLLLEAPKVIPNLLSVSEALPLTQPPVAAPEGSHDAEKPRPWYKRLFGLE